MGWRGPWLAEHEMQVGTTARPGQGRRRPRKTIDIHVYVRGSKKM